MGCVVRILALTWNIREILPEKETFKLRTEKRVGKEMEMNFMTRDHATSEYNTKCLYDMLQGEWLLNEPYEIVSRGGIWVGEGWRKKFLLTFYHHQGIIYHSSFLRNKIEQIIELQYLESTVESCQSNLETGTK